MHSKIWGTSSYLLITSPFGIILQSKNQFLKVHTWGFLKIPRSLYEVSIRFNITLILETDVYNSYHVPNLNQGLCSTQLWWLVLDQNWAVNWQSSIFNQVFNMIIHVWLILSQQNLYIIWVIELQHCLLLVV